MIRPAFHSLRLGGNTKASVILPMQLLFGGIAYGAMEVLWRGYTHPSMVLTGGVCFAMICTVNRKWKHIPLVLRSTVCALGITAMEFCVGMLVNFTLHMEVWDYSDEWMHLLGQICPLYSCLWFFLSLFLSCLLSFSKPKLTVAPLKKARPR